MRLPSAGTVAVLMVAAPATVAAMAPQLVVPPASPTGAPRDAAELTDRLRLTPQRAASTGMFPRPPKEGGQGELRELAQIKQIRADATPEGDAWAQRMDHEGILGIWWARAADYRKSTGVAQGWAGTALLGSAMAATGATTTARKLWYRRPRPFEKDTGVDPALRPSSASFPSGHAANAFAAARVLAALEPDKADDHYRAAAEVAASRVYAGVHYPSDVRAGAGLGYGIADRVARLVPGDG